MLKADAGKRPSLRSRLARHVLLPLALTWGLGSVVLLTVADHFAAQAFDRALLDDAYALAAHVHAEGSGVALHLTAQEMSTLLFDQSESSYFAVYDSSGALLAGNPGLSPARLAEGTTHEFAQIALEGQMLRSVSLRRDDPAHFVVVMAQTTASRTRLLQRLLVYSAVVQIWLLLVLAWWLRQIIERDLRPLGQLQQTLDERDAGDLAHLPSSLAQGATTLDVQRLGGAVNSLLSRLEGSLNAQREFAGNVAHELRTPLAGIRAQAAYALAQNDPALWREQLQGIAESEARASRLVDQLLALARAGEASAGLKLETLALNEVAREVVLRFLSKADALGVDLGAEGLDDVVLARGDVAMIEGILGNLLDNALRYGRGEVPRVTVAVRKDGDGAALCVADNGPGLDAVTASRLTQRWVQGAPGQRLGEGAGLGLAIVAQYADLMHAQLSFESAAQDAGLRVTVRFQA